MCLSKRAGAGYSINQSIFLKSARTASQIGLTSAKAGVFPLLAGYFGGSKVFFLVFFSVLGIISPRSREKAPRLEMIAFYPYKSSLVVGP
jgi:hypothetical protein